MSRPQRCFGSLVVTVADLDCRPNDPRDAAIVNIATAIVPGTVDSGDPNAITNAMQAALGNAVAAVCPSVPTGTLVPPSTSYLPYAVRPRCSAPHELQLAVLLTVRAATDPENDALHLATAVPIAHLLSPESAKYIEQHTSYLDLRTPDLVTVGGLDANTDAGPSRRPFRRQSRGGTSVGSSHASTDDIDDSVSSSGSEDELSPPNADVATNASGDSFDGGSGKGVHGKPKTGALVRAGHYLLRATQPALRSGASFVARIALQLQVESLDVAYRSGTLGAKGAQNAVGRLARAASSSTTGDKSKAAPRGAAGAAVAAARKNAAVEHKTSRWTAPSLRTTYGCMPLADLYQHMCFFAAVDRIDREHDDRGGEGSDRACDGDCYTAWPDLSGKKRVNAAVWRYLHDLTGAGSRVMPSVHRSLGRETYRWCLLRTLDLSSAIVGDANLPAVLAVVAECHMLERFVADRNGLSLASVPALVNVLGQHPSVTYVSLEGNEYFEAAGDQLLRLLNLNRRIHHLALEGSVLSAALQRRLATRLSRNAEEQAKDVFDAAGAHFAACVSPEDVPAASWRLTAMLWNLLIAAPEATGHGGIGEFSDVAIEPAGPKHRPRPHAENTADEAILPNVATAPLFVAVATRVFRTMCAAIEDPVVQQLAAPLCGLQAPSPSAEEGRGEVNDGQAVAAQVARAFQLAEAQSAFGVAADGGTTLKRTTPEGAAVQNPPSPSVAASYTETNASAGPVAPEAVVATEYLYPVSFTKMFVLGMSTATRTPHLWPYALRALRSLGHAQEQLGVQRRTYTVYSKALFDALVHELGPDVMHSGVQAALLQSLAFVFRTVMSGRTDATA